MLAICSECHEVHYWYLVDMTKYQFICGACCGKPNIKIHPEEGYYCRHAYCTCGKLGPVNFKQNIYWCLQHPHERML